MGSGPPAAARRWSLLLLEVATLLSGVGNGVSLVVLPWLVLERTGDAGAAGLVAAAAAVPLLASSLLSGTVIDMLGRRRTAIASDLASAASVAAIPVVDATLGLDLGWLVGLAVLGAVFDPAGMTARETMLPAAAERAGWSLDRANGVHEAVWGVAFLVGPGVGGVLIAWIGAVDTLWVAAVGFVASAGLVALMRVSGAGRPEAHERPEGVWAGTVEGLAFIWRDRLLRAVMVLTAVVVSLYMPIEGVLLPVHFEAQGEPGRLGALIMVMSAGGIAGALAYSRVARRWRRSVVFRLAMVLTAAAVVGLSPLPPYGAMVALAFVLGLVFGPVNPLVNLAVQVRTPERLRGRVVGVVTSTSYAAGPLGYLVVGAAAQRFGVRPTFVGLAVVLSVLAVGALAVRSLGELDHLDGARPQGGRGEGSPRGAAEAIEVATTIPLLPVLPPRAAPGRATPADEPPGAGR